MSFNSQLLLSNAYDEQVTMSQDAFAYARQALSRTNSIRVLVIGDSISEGAHCAIDEYNFVGRLKKSLKEKFGNKLTFANYHAGGQTIKSFIGNSFRPPAEWNTSNKTWKQAALDFKPHLVFFAMGVNTTDVQGFKDYEADTKTVIGIFNGQANVCFVNNLELGNESVTAPVNQRLKNIAKTQFNIARDAGYNASAIDSYRIYKLLTTGKDESSFEGYQQPLWAGRYTPEWENQSGVNRSNAGDWINVTDNSKSNTTLRHKKHSRDILFEAMLDLTDVKLQPNSKVIFCSRENGLMEHMIAVLFEVGVDANKYVHVKIGTAFKTYADNVFRGVASNQKHIHLRIGNVGDVAYVEIKHGNSDWTRVGEAIMPSSECLGSPYFQFENMKNLKVVMPGFYHSLEKKSQALCTVIDIYGDDALKLSPDVEVPNGGNGINHPCDHAFAFIYSKAIKTIVNSI